MPAFASPRPSADLNVFPRQIGGEPVAGPADAQAAAVPAVRAPEPEQARLRGRRRPLQRTALHGCRPR